MPNAPLVVLGGALVLRQVLAGMWLEKARDRLHLKLVKLKNDLSEMVITTCNHFVAQKALLSILPLEFELTVKPSPVLV